MTLQDKCKAELKGVGRLGWAILKALFHPETCIYSCQACNQTISLRQKKCDRCDSLLGWEPV